MKSIKVLVAAAVAAAGSTAAGAAIMSTQTSPAGAVALIGAGATVADFESFAPGEYSSLTTGGLTVTSDNGHIFADNAYAGTYNNFGNISAHNCYCGDSFGALTFTFAVPTAHFGFFFGASDVAWTLSTFGPGGTLIDTASIGPTHASNAGDFFYSLSGPIKSVTLVGQPGDYIFIDNVTYNGNTVPEPAAWALMIAGFGLVGSALRGRRAVLAA